MRQWRVTSKGTITDSPLPGGVTSMARGNGITVAVGTTLATSRDEQKWVTRYSDFADGADVVGLACDTNGGSVALLTHRQFGRSGSFLAESLDGTNWFRVGTYYENLASLTFGAGKFVVVGIRGTIIMSTNRAAWWLD
ncbi:MAG TPA: hypothetical protein VK530_13160, partial [Candidatus Acidoferrum sp.]|nr:hypothetical protein [Candidatus Acidoferrum sp.]